MRIPRELYSKEILSYIDYLVDDHAANDFDSLDLIHKDKLVALGLKAFDGDAEIVLSQPENFYMFKILTDTLQENERENQIDFITAIKEAYYDSFSNNFNLLIQERCDERQGKILRSFGFSPCTDAINGEILWRKSA